MNEELQTAITEILNSMIGAAESAYQFGAEQMPDVINELLLWNIIYSISWCIPAIMIFFGMVLANYMMWRKGGFAYDGFGTMEEESPIVCCIMNLFGMGLSFALFNMDWLKIIVAPKVWLIEYAADMVK